MSPIFFVALIDVLEKQVLCIGKRQNAPNTGRNRDVTRTVVV
jgi:hypothetical protein